VSRRKVVEPPLECAECGRRWSVTLTFKRLDNPKELVRLCVECAADVVSSVQVPREVRP
jgi:hypothetical protein